jgi:hypothetical protein
MQIHLPTRLMSDAHQTDIVAAIRGPAAPNSSIGDRRHLVHAL